MESPPSAGRRHRRLTTGSIDVPISQFRVIEHKLGFKPVLQCACGAILDRNRRTISTKAFLAEHALCPPKSDMLTAANVY